ncbi:MAG: hypothetical protein ACRD29_16845 [Acidimicrobiales bacterium]
MHREDRAHEGTELWADVLDDRLLHRLKRRLDAARGVDDHPPAGDEHPVQLGEGAGPVLHEHEAIWQSATS